MNLRTPGLALALLVFALPAARAATVEDGPPVNARQMLQDLQKLNDTQTTSVKSRKLAALQAAQAAAANPAKAVELWEGAVQAMQFQGLSHDSLQFKEWKNGEGEALKEKEVQFALRLYFSWLALTIQRSNGASNKELLTPVMNYAREAASDQTMMDAFLANLKKEKETIAQTPAGQPRRNVPASVKKEKNTDDLTRRVHDQIMNQSLGGSAYAQAMKISDIISDIAPPKKPRGQAAQPNETGWEGTPGNVDGIYMQIIQPELRAMRDPRVMEYWDFKLRREADIASANKLAADIAKFNEQRRPQLLWSRAEEWMQIGLKNRAAADMFSVIKTNPTAPEAASWISELTALLAPPPVPAPTTSTAAPVSSASALPAIAAPAPEALPGSVLPPGTVAPGAR